MIVYYVDDDNIVQSKEYGDIANVEAFERELDQSYEFWSYDKSDCYGEQEDEYDRDDECDATESDIY